MDWERVRALQAWLTSESGRRWILRGLAAFVVIGFPIWIRGDGDYRGYLMVGELVLQRRHIYLDAPPGVNTWPPFFSVLCVPLALVAQPTVYLSRALWVALNFVCLWWVLRLVVRAVYRGELHARATPAELSLAAPAVVVPLLMTFRPITANLDYLQINIVLLALTLGALSLDQRGRWLGGGILLGLATAIKVMPGVFVPYLIYRGRWRMALAAVAATAAFSLTPIAVFGWGRFWEHARTWLTVMGDGWGVGKGNQSVPALWDRLIGHGMWPLTADGVMELPKSGATAVTVLVALSCTLVALLALWLFRGDARANRWILPAEWSIVLLVGAVFGPASWKSYLVVLLLPHTLLFAAWRSAEFDERTRRVIAWVLFGTFALGGLTARGFVGKTLAGRLEMSSAVAIASLVLLGGLFWFRARVVKASG